MNPTTSLVPLDREINKTLRELKKKKKHEKQASKQPVGSTSHPQNSSVASNNTFLDQHFIMAERREDHREHEREAREHEHERERRERREQEDEHHFEGVGNYMMMIDLCVSSPSHMHRLHLKVFMLTPLTLRSKDLFLLICLSLQVFRMRMLTHTCLASIILVPP